MPKMKTNRGAAKRVVQTAHGFKHRRAFRNHILTKKSAKRKLQLRQNPYAPPSEVIHLHKLLPYR